MRNEPDKATPEAGERVRKIAAMQRLIDEARAGGASERSFDEIITEARSQALARRKP